MPTRFGATLPDWVVDEATVCGPSLENQMGLVLRLAARNPIEGSGGPFAALVTDTDSGEILAAGVNLVLSSNLSAAHAEVVALSLAQTRLGTWNLAGRPRTLVVNWRPCAQCYGAAMWSGISRLVIAGEGPECERYTGFDEGPMRTDWAEQFADRGIEVVVGVLREEAVAGFQAYGDLVASRGLTVYNPR